MNKEERREIDRMFFWGTAGLLAIVLAMMMGSCTTPKNVNREVQTDYTGELNRMQVRMDSLLYNMKIMQRETSEKLSNIKIENTTTYLSVPDSTGKQYPTVISETKANKEEKENKTTDTEIYVTMQRLIEEVSELKQQVTAFVTEKDKVVQVSWWQLHKVDVYAVLFAVIIIGWLVYKKRNK